MEKIRRWRNACALLLCFFAVVLVVSTVWLAGASKSLSSYNSWMSQLLATRPVPRPKPVIRLAVLENLSLPAFPKLYGTLALEPDRKTVKVFLCQETDTIVGRTSSTQVFEGMCGTGSRPRSIMAMLDFPANTDGTYDGNQRALDELKLSFGGMPPGQWQLKGLDVSQSQIQALIETMHTASEQAFQAKRAALESNHSRDESAVRYSSMVAMISMGFLIAVFVVLRQLYFRFFRFVLFQAFAGELERSAETDALMPFFPSLRVGLAPRAGRGSHAEIVGLQAQALSASSQVSCSSCYSRVKGLSCNRCLCKAKRGRTFGLA